MTRRWIALLAVLLFVPAARAHMNSPNVYLEEAAGPWETTTVVMAPPAIPGEARVEVRVRDLAEGEEAKVRFMEIPPEGEEHSPGWVEARRNSADPSLFVAPMPLMTFGVWRARIEVSGARGTGTLDIPVEARVPASGRMPGGLAAFLGALAGFLVLALWKIVGAFTRDVYAPSIRVPGWIPRFFPAGVTLAFLLVLGFHFLAWWQYDRILERRSFRSTRGELSVVGGRALSGRPVPLRLEVKDAKGNPVDDLREDHGKIMHAVVVGVPGLDYFLHVHPRRTSAGTFEFTLFPPRAGTYRVFADLLHPLGNSESVTDTVEVDDGGEGRATSFDDPDDSDTVVPPIGELSPGNETFDCGDGFTMRRVSPAGGTVRVGELVDLGVELDGPDGRPVEYLDRYMGMAGHLLIVRHDLGVFAHVHPTGTLGGRMAMPASHQGMSPEEHAKHMATMMARIEGARVSFPYGFPSPGRYRLFVQVKHLGEIRTGVFDLDAR